jgi:hypothetical protein
MADEKENSGAKDGGAPGDIPEVEAEVVSDATSETKGLFADTPKDAPDGPEEQKSERIEVASEHTRRGLVSPGVLFFAGLTLAALAAGAYWYFTAREPSASEALQQTPEPTASAPSTEQIEGENKVANTSSEQAKGAAENPSPLAAGDAVLPDAAPDFDNATLIEEAKGTTQDAPAEIEDTASVDNNEPPTITFEIDGENVEDLGSAPADGVLDTAQGDTVGSAATKPVDETPADAKLTSDSEGRAGAGDSDATAQPSLDEAAAPGALETNLEAENQPLEKSAEPAVAHDMAAAEAAEPATDLTERDTDESERVAALETALAEEKARAEAVENDLARLRAEQAEILVALQTANNRAAAAEAEAAVLREENAALERTAQNSPVAAGAIALNAVSRAVDEGRPFAGDLAALARLAPDADAINTLKPHAEIGAPTMAEISAAFDDAARQGLAVAGRENANGVWERYAARAASVVSVRPATPQPGDKPRAIISRAEHAVEIGDLETALYEVQMLPEPAQDAMHDWVQMAQSRASINQALRSLTAMIADQANG